MMKKPACDHDPSECRITQGVVSTTAIAWKPVYDGTGKRVDPGDPNTVTVSFSCEVCGMGWQTKTQGGKTELVTNGGAQLPA